MYDHGHGSTFRIQHICEGHRELTKYKDLEIEISRMWGMKTETIPVVIGSLGLMKKGLENFSDCILGNIDLNTIQKMAFLGTAHILRKIFFDEIMHILLDVWGLARKW